MVAPELERAAALVALLAGAFGLVSGGLLLTWWRLQRRRKALARQLSRLGDAGTLSGRPTAQLVRRQDTGRYGRWMHMVVSLVPMLRDTDLLLEQADVSWHRATVLKLSLGLMTACALLASVLFDSGLAIGAGLWLGASLPYLYLLRRKRRRIRVFEEQLPGAIDLLTRAIRAGHAVPTGLKLVAEDSAEPLAAEFRRAFDEQRYGIPFEDALLAMTRRIELVDLRVMVVAILIQREVGGNLAEVLQKISGLIRARFTIRRQMRVYTAQGRMSGYVLGILPLAVGGLIYSFNPAYVQTLFTDPLGKAMLISAVTLQLLGYAWIYRILKISL